MNMKEYAFGIDLGGTTAKVGLFTTAGALLEKWEVPTDTSNAGEHILGNLAKAVKDKMQENGITAEQVEGVGVGVPGPVLDSRIVPIVCANLGGWGERNVSIQLSGLLDGMKVLVALPGQHPHRQGHERERHCPQRIGCCAEQRGSGDPRCQRPACSER